MTSVTVLEMKSETLPMKASVIYTEQFNLRIERQLKEDIRFLTDSGVEVSDLVRPLLREAILRAKKQVEESRAS